MSPTCWSCRERPAVAPDGRCAACAALPAESLPTQTQPPPGDPGPPQAPPQSPPQAPPPPPPAQDPYQAPQQQGPYPQYPAYPAYPVAPGGAGAGVPPQFSSPKGLSTALTVLLSVCIGVWSLSTLADGRMMGVLTDVEEGDLNGILEFDDANDFYSAMGIFQALALIGTGIVFIIWFHRTRVNAELFEPAGHRMARGWSIGGWFVPVVNWWFPKKIANDVWRASTPWSASPARGVLTAWWVLWVISSATSALAVVLGGGDDETIDTQDELDSAQAEVSMATVSDLVGIAAAILALLFVRRLSERQLVKYEQGPVPPGGAPGPVGPGSPAPPPYGGMPPYGA